MLFPLLRCPLLRCPVPQAIWSPNKNFNLKNKLILTGTPSHDTLDIYFYFSCNAYMILLAHVPFTCRFTRVTVWSQKERKCRMIYPRYHTPSPLTTQTLFMRIQIVMKSTWLPFKLPTRRVRRKTSQAWSFVSTRHFLSTPKAARMASRRILGGSSQYLSFFV